ncbi:MAG: response regulator [Polyangiaceae bacterium]
MRIAPKRAAMPYGQAVGRFVDLERKLRVLVVDDEPSVRRTVRRILGKECLAFLEASDLEEARAALHCHTPPDVIVLDLALRTDRPDEGFGFLRDLRREVAYTPVVVLSGRADVKIAVEAMHLGAIDVIEKGESGERVRDAVRRALELAIAKHTSKEVVSTPRLRNSPQAEEVTLEEDADDEEVDEATLEDDLAVVFPHRHRMMKPLEQYVDEVKRQIVAEAIARSGGNLTDAARLLKMPRTNFHRLAVRLKLHEPNETRRAKSGTQRAAVAMVEDPADAITASGASGDDDSTKS